MRTSRSLCVILVFAGSACSSVGAPRPTVTIDHPPAPGSSSVLPNTSGSTTVGPGIGDGTVAPPVAASTARGGIVVPRAGTYRYDVTEDAHTTTGPATSRYVQHAEVDPPVSRDDGSVSVEIRTTRDGSDEVAGEVFAHRTDRIDLLFADRCVLERPALHYRLPLRVGASWPSPRRCEGESDGATTRVLRRETQRIGGVAVDTFVIRRTGSFGDPQAVKTQWFSPRYHLVVRSDLRDTQDGEPHRVVQVLRSLTPA